MRTTPSRNVHKTEDYLKFVASIDIYGFTDTKIKIRCNQIITPSQSERIKIIMEDHSAATGGHKEENKILKRIKNEDI